MKESVKDGACSTHRGDGTSILVRRSPLNRLRSRWKDNIKTVEC